MTSSKLGIGVATAALMIMMPIVASAQTDCKPELTQAGEPSVSRPLGAFPSYEPDDVASTPHSS